jgi:hypothetical protein
VFALTGSCLGNVCERVRQRWRLRFYPPTLEVASVRLFNVVLLPDEGLPTRPIRGSRGILGSVELKFLHLYILDKILIDKKCGVLGLGSSEDW